MMNTETAAALEESILHWRRIREDPDCGEDPGEDYCALCKLFSKDRCSRACPVAAATGKGCRTDPSPWRAANLAWYYYHMCHSAVELAAWRSAADAEVAFLEGLRDE